MESFFLYPTEWSERQWSSKYWERKVVSVVSLSIKSSNTRGEWFGVNHSSKGKQDNGESEHQTPECEDKQVSAGYSSDFSRRWFPENPPIFSWEEIVLLGSFHGQKQQKSQKEHIPYELFSLSSKKHFHKKSVCKVSALSICHDCRRRKFYEKKKYFPSHNNAMLLWYMFKMQALLRENCLPAQGEHLEGKKYKLYN